MSLTILDVVEPPQLRRTNEGLVVRSTSSVVMEREELTLEQRNGLRTPTTTTDLDLAPLYMFWFIDPTAPNRGPRTLKQLVDVGAINASLIAGNRHISRP